MKIAIIDSGLDSAHKKFHNAHINGVKISKKNGLFTYENNFTDNFGHGTACAGIIHSINPDCELIGVKVFDHSLCVKEDFICEAIKWCLCNNIKIINLSLGIQTYTLSDLLIRLFEEAYQKDIIIIAAAHNNINLEVYPAFFPTVFGVTTGNLKKNEWGYIANSPIEFIAKGSLQRVVWCRGGNNFTGGTSYASPHLAGIVSKIINETGLLEISEIKNFLIEKAKPDSFPIQIQSKSTREITPIISKNEYKEVCQKYFDRNKRFSWINNLAIFPVSEKELNIFIKSPEYSSFKIGQLIDYPKNLKRTDNDESILTSKLDQNDLKRFDTLVLGYFHEQLFEANLQYGHELLKIAVKENKNLFILDPILSDFTEKLRLNLQSNSRIYISKIDEIVYKDIIKFKFLPELKVPVIAVIGTGSKQGKFTTQLRIKKILQDEGYKVSHLSTEPHSELLGADFCYPIGYNKNVQLDSEKRIVFLRTILKLFQQYLKPNIIITGTQGWIVPRGFNIISDQTQMLNFLYGIQPDVVICAINPEDSKEQILDTVDGVRIFTKAKPIFYVLTPYKRENKGDLSTTIMLNKLEYDKRIRYFSELLNNQVINILDSNYDDLILKTIENSF